MDKLIFPPFEIKIKSIGGKTLIFDSIRKKYIVLTPEEWVRQHLIHFLINEMEYPKSLISVEDGMNFNNMQKRTDVLVYDRQGQIFLVVECKSTKVKLSQKSMNQLSAYNQHYQAKYLVLSNGMQVIISKIDYAAKKAEFISQFPDFP